VRNALLFLVLLLVASCAIEEAQPQKTKQLTIAQNFMNTGQKKILSKIAKRRGINLSILELNANEVRKAIQQNPWEPGFDLIILDGISALQQLKGLAFEYHEPAFAAIPIGVSYVPDSIVKVRHFNDLANQYLWATADDKSEAILKAHLAYTYRQRATNKQLNKIYKDLLRGFKDHQLAFDTYQLQNTLLLCRYDTHVHELKKAVKKRQFTFALKNQNHFFADYMSLSIVEQTPNYNTAKSFVAYLNYMRDHNATFRNTFGILTKRKTTRQPSPKTLLEFLEK
jgi:hypothetical protein